MLRKRADDAAKAAEESETAEEEADLALREYKAGRRYTGSRVERSTSRKRHKDAGWGDAISSVVMKELKGTTGRRIVRGILGGLFKGR